jgi:phosphohistidine phosphatase
MRCILLLRHAEAVAHSKGGDIERELSTQGRAESLKLGRFMARNGLWPDHVLVSPAARTRETIDLVQQGWASPAQLDVRKSLYLAESSQLIEELRETPNDARTVMLVAHNPGLAELAVHLVARGDAKLRDRLSQGLPTCALAVLDVDCEDWRDLSLHSARLVSLITPDKLGA